MTTINVANDFSKYPAGRFKSDGPFSGESFRDKILIPALKKDNATIEIDLDGARGYGSSFLEEAFGGTVRKGFSPESLLSRIQFISTRDPSLIEEIKRYINRRPK